MNDRRRSPIVIWFAQFVCVTVGVYIVGRLGRVSAIPSGEVITIWSPSGIALATLLLFGNRIWPGVWLGSFLIEVTTTFQGYGTDATAKSLAFAATIGVGMVLQAAAGSWVLRRALGKIPTLDNVKEVLALMGLGGVVSTALGAAARTVCLTGDARGILHWPAWPAWRANWCAELMGVLVFAPLALILLNPRTRTFGWPQPLRLLESVTLFVVIPVVVLQLSDVRETDYGAILFTVSVLWATLRFGKVGTGLILVVMAMILASNVKVGSDLLGTIRTNAGTATTDAQILQGTFSLTFWILAAILYERERATKDLRENEARFRQFSEGMSHIIWMMTPDKKRFLYVNRAFERIYGRKREELYAASDLWLAGIHPEDRHRVAESRSTSAEAGDYCEEYRVVHADGTVRWLRESAVPLRDEQGAICMFGGTAEDITQSRQIAQELARQQSELLHVSRLSSVGQMIATLSHEVAQPMSAIGTFATVCAKHLQSKPAENWNRLENVKQCIAAITAENQRCRAILRRLRDYTRKTPQHRTACDMNAVLRESIDLILHELRRIDIKVCCELAPSMPLVSGDQTQLQQVIINLLTNARDAMLPVDPSRRVVVLRSRVEGDSVTIEVEDQGIGLPVEESGRIFEPFFTTKAEGMGIGLSVCKTILEDHGGEIHAFTNAYGGATFRILLPAGDRSSDERRLRLQSV
jgi:PAS domain S-box-containing protein